MAKKRKNKGVHGFIGPQYDGDLEGVHGFNGPEYESKVPTAPHHLFILSVYWDCKTKNNDPDYEPGTREVWAALEGLIEAEPDHALLREVSKDRILWRGSDQPMGRRRLGNLLSEFHTLDDNTIQEVLRKAT